MSTSALSKLSTPLLRSKGFSNVSVPKTTFARSNPFSLTLVRHNTTDNKKYRIAASIVVERHPLVLPEIQPWESEYYELRKSIDEEEQKLSTEAWKKRLEEELKIRAKKTKSQAKKQAKMEEKQAKKEAAKPTEVVEETVQTTVRISDEDELFPIPPKDTPRITPADLANDRKSLYRALEESLFLIVKKNRDQNAWQFPQGTYEQGKDANNLRKTAEREIAEECGKELQVHFIGNGPIGHYVYDLPEADKKKFGTDATKLFFFQSIFVKGKVKINEKELVDHLWVTRDELKEYFEPSYYEYVKKIVSVPNKSILNSE